MKKAEYCNIYLQTRCPYCQTANFFYYGDPNDCTSGIDIDVGLCHHCKEKFIITDKIDWNDPDHPVVVEGEPR